MTLKKYLPKKSVLYALSFVPRLFYGFMFYKERLNFSFHKLHDRDFLFFKNCAGMRPGDQFIDIGGNYGQSALSFSTVDRMREIVSFEPNTTLEPYLKTVKRLLGRRYRYHLVGVGDTASLLELYVPRLNKVMLTGEASFDEAEVNSDMVRERIGLPYSLSKTQCRIERFDDLVEQFGLRPFMIKIDIQGYEPFALKGMVNSVKKFQPMFLLERNSDSQFGEMNSIFEGYGYDVWYYVPTTNKLSRTDPHLSANYFAFPRGVVERDFSSMIDSLDGKEIEESARY